MFYNKTDHDELEYASRLFKMGAFEKSDFGIFDICKEFKNEILFEAKNVINKQALCKADYILKYYLVKYSAMPLNLKLKKVKKKLKKLKKKRNSLYDLCGHNNKDIIYNNSYDYFSYYDYFLFINSDFDMLQNHNVQTHIKIKKLEILLNYFSIEYKDLKNEKAQSYYKCNAFHSAPNLMSIQDLFLESHSNYSDYINVLIKCEPPLLLKSSEHYHYIWNNKTQKSCVGYYFNVLKRKGIVKPNLNRDVIAFVLSNCIKDFKISGPSVQNTSNTYSTVFEPQFDKEIKRLTNNI
ncbi:MAG: hypothetical protein C0596_06705 [Marinilabiliales bacterium]|nr:MAG: hypothetical protein C0596_06705 [Marinilabiliales bacterium]